MTSFHDQCQNDQVGCHVRLYRIYDLFPIPDGFSLILSKRFHGKVEFIDCPPHVLVSIHKDGCAKFHGHIGCVIIRMNCSASFKEVSQS